MPATRYRKRFDQLCVTMQPGRSGSPPDHTEASARPPPPGPASRDKGMIARRTTSFVVESLGSKPGMTTPSSASCLQNSSKLRMEIARSANSCTLPSHSSSGPRTPASSSRSWLADVSALISEWNCGFFLRSSSGEGPRTCQSRPERRATLMPLRTRSARWSRAMVSSIHAGFTPDQLSMRYGIIKDHIAKVVKPIVKQQASSTVRTRLAQAASAWGAPRTQRASCFSRRTLDAMEAITSAM
mmetsp:Transcript_88786/g.271906  ORF Transcript_88786/g.271906 Transcript_88786/m.271906 type:complete len:242 (+) Transcript_88786:851-1576(+)